MNIYAKTFKGLMLGGAAMAFAVFMSGCVQPKFKIFTDTRDPLQERVLSGTGKDKILMIPISGFISDVPGFSLIESKPSMLQEAVSQLRIAALDPDVKSVLLKINSPGGSVTASDILYHEIKKFKKETGAKVIVCMMDVCASGGYYISLPADLIVAHPTTVTGSVGVIFVQPKVSGLMGKIGVSVDVTKSGQNKDMGSPFRPQTDEEKKMFQALIDSLGQRFMDLAKANRKFTPEALKNIATGRVYIAGDALKLGLVDKIGYISDALEEARKLAKLTDDATVIAYRRSFYPHDNIYNNTNNSYDGGKVSLVNLGIFDNIKNMSPGFYYMWTPSAMNAH